MHRVGASVGASILPSAGPFKYYRVPAATQIAGDLHLALAIAFPSVTPRIRNESRPCTSRTRPIARGPWVLRRLRRRCPLRPRRLTFDSGRRDRFRRNTEKLLDLQFTQTNAARTVSILATEAYMAGGTTYDITVPDFSGVASWDNNWGPKVGSETEWRVSTYGFTGIGFKGAGRSSTFTP